MEVRLSPNSRRPGVGLQPRREATRPLLPQHARHCPVLEAGSALGFMVYAPLEPKESLFIEYEGEGRYRFVYYLQTQDGKPTPIFQVTMSLSVGGVGMVKEEVTFVGAPMLVVRVETDWYAHETEFRYVLQAGEGITVDHSIPIGQVLFQSREEITMRSCTNEEVNAFEESRQEFNRHKAAAVQKTSYGLSYSPHYIRQSRTQKS